MAAPVSMNLSDISGRWTMNKTLSGDFEAILAIQGIDWIKRKTLSMVSVNLDIKHHVEAGVTHIDIGQMAGSIKGEDDNRTLDWVERERDDDLFGHIKFKSRWIKPEELEHAILKDGWLQEEAPGGLNGESLIHTVIHGKDWVANEVLGFAVIGGVRRLTKRVLVTKGKEQKTIILTYDFIFSG